MGNREDHCRPHLQLQASSPMYYWVGEGEKLPYKIEFKASNIRNIQWLPIKAQKSATADYSSLWDAWIWDSWRLGLGYPQVHYGEPTWDKQKIVPALLSRALTIMEKNTQCTWTPPGPGPSPKGQSFSAPDLTSGTSSSSKWGNRHWSAHKWPGDQLL